MRLACRPWTVWWCGCCGSLLLRLGWARMLFVVQHDETGKVAWSVIRNSSKRRDIVLDPFGGSGSTLIAAEKTGRQARLVELDPSYKSMSSSGAGRIGPVEPLLWRMTGGRSPRSGPSGHGLTLVIRHRSITRRTHQDRRPSSVANARHRVGRG